MLASVSMIILFQRKIDASTYNGICTQLNQIHDACLPAFNPFDVKTFVAGKIRDNKIFGYRRTKPEISVSVGQGFSTFPVFALLFKDDIDT